MYRYPGRHAFGGRVTHPESLRAVVSNGLCIGCGLCESIAGSRSVRISMTAEGRERPIVSADLSVETEDRILDVCPGAVVEARPPEEGVPVDLVWGVYRRIVRAWAADPDTRFRAATGGVLTALGQFLLHSARVRAVLHVGADPDAPMRSRWVISRTVDEVLCNAQSRYGPAAPLAGLETLLAMDAPFAVICKPCDAGALWRLRRSDPRMTRCVAVLVMVCGGASELGKSQSVLAALGIEEEELSLFRYRGYGNPGKTRIETRDGRAFELSYQDMWSDEKAWRLQSRCKVCPDAIGEAADIAAADIWPGGGPVGEDAGFNGVLVRSSRGLSLFDAAVEAGFLIADEEMSARDLDICQPHQVRKKRGLRARFQGMSEAGAPVPKTVNLRLSALQSSNDPEADERAREGTRVRVAQGRFRESFSVTKD